MTEQLPDGLYFGMDEDRYHALPMVSAHNIKDLTVSPLNYWENSWMNTQPEDEDEDDDTFAKVLGRAYHTRILEGKEVFAERYAPAFIAPDEALVTSDDIKERLKEKGLKVGGKKQDLIDRLIAADPSVIIADALEAEYREAHDGKVLLPVKYLNRIERAAYMIEKHPQVGKAFTGGYPEVTCIWTEDDVQRRCRFDYLKPAMIVDLKSFANKLEKPVREAICNAIGGAKHHVQAEYYIKGGRAAVQFAREKKVHVCSTEFRHQPDEDFLRLLAEQQGDHQFWFVFQQTGKAPVARTYRFDCCQGMRGAANARINEAIAVFKEHRDRHGTAGEPWVDATPPDNLDDTEFPPWAA